MSGNFKKPGCFGTVLTRFFKGFVHHRKKLVKMKTEVKNRIHTVVDHPFPGFLDETQSSIRPFSTSSLYLMSDRFSTRQLLRRKLKSLTKALNRFGTRNPGSFICLVTFAEIELTKKTEPIITCLYGPISLANGADWST